MREPIIPSESHQPGKAWGWADVAIITAAEGEDEAVLQVRTGAIGEWQPIMRPPGYPFAVHGCDFECGSHRGLRVVVTRAYQPGVEASTHAAVHMADFFRPACLAMSGVCAGRPEWTQLGDVIVADRLLRYDVGEILSREDGSAPIYLTDENTFPLRPGWKQIAEALDMRRDAEWLVGRPIPIELQEEWVLRELLEERDPIGSPGRSAQCPEWSMVIDSLRSAAFVDRASAGVALRLTDSGRARIQDVLLQGPNQLQKQRPWRIHVGPLGTGSDLVRDAGIWRRLTAHHRLIRGFDMEASAIGVTARLQGIDYAVVKGVMDFGLPRRDNTFRSFAARAAAEVLIFLLRQVLPPPRPEPGRAQGPPPDSPGILADFDGRLEAIENEMSELAQMARDPNIDAFLTSLKGLTAKATDLLERLESARALARPIRAEVDRFFRVVQRIPPLLPPERPPGAASDALVAASALLLRSVEVPLKRLVRELDPGSIYFVGTDAFPTWVTGDRLLEELMSKDELEQHGALLEIAGRGQGAFFATIGAIPADRQTRALGVLFDNAHVLISQGERRCEPVLTAAAQFAIDRGLRDQWRELDELFTIGSPTFDDAEAARAVIEKYPSEVRRAFARCLLKHPRHVRLAASYAEPKDYWHVVVDPTTPFGRRLEFWKRLRSEGETYAKVFLICAYESCKRIVGLEMGEDVVALLREMYEVPCFYEGTYFETLAEFHDLVSSAVRLDEEHERRYREFRDASGQRAPSSLEWEVVPLPIQRRLARLGRFLEVFVRHPRDPIAMECLPHLLLRGSIVDILEMHDVNRTLLDRLSMSGGYYRSELSRLALCRNPRVSGRALAENIGKLSLASLARLSRDHAASAQARKTANEALRRLRAGRH